MMNNSRFRKLIAILIVMCFTCLSFNIPINYNIKYSEASTDEKFEKKMDKQGFPESYKPYLRALHEEHPSWVFKANHTGISWNDLIENEKNIPGRVNNLIYGTYYNPHYNWRSTVVGYNWYTDSYSTFDGSVWYAASDDILAYYMDPRTYMYEEYIFAFETLDYQKGYQNINGVEAILDGSFMYQTTPTKLFKSAFGSDAAKKKKQKGDDKTYSQIILEAAEAHGVSAYHLASRIKLEMGNSAGVASLGNSSSYPGIYNYFNIGAFDSAVGDAVLNGLRYAAGEGSFGRPWNSVYKSIMGGAEYLSGEFISEGQNTIYTQKFNVTNESCLFYNQYMSNIQAPATESYIEYEAYVEKGLVDSSFVFEIPVYLDMPDAAVEKPADSGSPNNWLDSLSVKGYKLNPEFSGETTDYTIVIPDKVTSLDVSASTVNEYASIDKTGQIKIKSGETKVTLKVTAENGDVRKYKINVKRDNSATEATTETTTEETTEKTEDSSKTTENSSETTEDTSGDTTEETTEQPVIHKGDLNGDDKINALDIIFVQRIIVGLDELTDEKLLLADINGDGKINALDIIFIQRHIVGLELISWE